MQESVSVIIPVFNRKEELIRAVESVLNQTYTKFEIIIIDDCSEIEMEKVIDNFNDNRIIYIKNKKNSGVSFSRNIGIQKAKYDFIAFLDSDDSWIKTKLEKQISYFKNNIGCLLVHTEEIWIRNGVRVNQKKHHKKSGGNIFKRSLKLCLMSPSSIMIKKEIFNKYGLFDETMQVCEDYDLWIRILAFENPGFIEKPLIIKYGGHSDQLSRKYEAMDRFRVYSLIKLLKNKKINKIQKEEVKQVILNKSKILLQGAVKRNRKEDIKIYQGYLKKYN